MPKSQKFCIFCGGPGMTKEDVWPTWLKPFVPRNAKGYEALSGVVHLDRIDQSTRKHDGDPQSRRVPLVCRSCNSGWMSRLQERAKPVVLPLIQGKAAILSEADQRLVATWAAMSVMTSDFFYPDRQAISQADRDRLRTTGTIPEDRWKIWIGLYDRGDWVGKWLKFSWRIATRGEERAAETTATGLPKPNTQTTTIVFGKLYVHAFSCPFEDIASWVHLSEKGASMLALVWPVQEQFIAWPPASLTEKNASQLGSAIFGTLDAVWRNAKGLGPGPVPAK